MARLGLQELRDRAAAAVRSGDLETALSSFRQLEAVYPEDPSWPQRKADVYRKLGDASEELAARVRAADLYSRRGLALQAIATWKLVLLLDPQNPKAHECLAKLSACEPKARDKTRKRGASPLALDAVGGRDAPLDDVPLSEVIPNSHPAHLADITLPGVSEIPLDTSPDMTLDLGLEGSEFGSNFDRLDDPLEVDDASSDSALGEWDELDAPLYSEAESTPPLEEGADLDPASSSSDWIQSAQQQLAVTPLFGSLDPAGLRHLIENLEIVEVGEGEILFHQGDRADALYVVVEGAVVPIAEGRQRRKLAVLEPGEFFGEIGLVTNQPRNATIQALVDSKLLVIDRSTVWALVHENADVFTVMLRFLRDRLIDRLIRTSPIFQAFAHAKRSSLVKQFRFLEVAEDCAVIEQDGEPQGLFVLLAGEMHVRQNSAGGSVDLATLYPGAVFGEMSLSSGEPAMAAVIATRKCWLLVLDEGRYQRLVAKNPRFEKLLQQIAERRDQRNRGSELPL